MVYYSEVVNFVEKLAVSNSLLGSTFVETFYFCISQMECLRLLKLANNPCCVRSGILALIGRRVARHKQKKTSDQIMIRPEGIRHQKHSQPAGIKLLGLSINILLWWHLNTNEVCLIRGREEQIFATHTFFVFFCLLRSLLFIRHNNCTKVEQLLVDCNC